MVDLLESRIIILYYFRAYVFSVRVIFGIFLAVWVLFLGTIVALPWKTQFWLTPYGKIPSTVVNVCVSGLQTFTIVSEIQIKNRISDIFWTKNVPENQSFGPDFRQCLKSKLLKTKPFLSVWGEIHQSESSAIFVADWNFSNEKFY